MPLIYIFNYCGNTEIYTVPEIKDSNRKQNKDVRDFYGPPAKTGAAQASGRENEPGTGEPTRPEEIRRGAPPDRSPDLFNLFFIFLPPAIAAIQWRRQRKNAKR